MMVRLPLKALMKETEGNKGDAKLALSYVPRQGGRCGTAEFRRFNGVWIRKFSESLFNSIYILLVCQIRLIIRTSGGRYLILLWQAAYAVGR